MSPELTVDSAVSPEGATDSKRPGSQNSHNLPRLSQRWFDWFAWYTKRYLRRHFHAVRVSQNGPIPSLTADPVIVMLNHPSWWDPLVGVFLANTVWPSRRHYAPIDSSALEKYRFFERLGFFGVAPGTVRGARAFLQKGRAIVGDQNQMLWITAQGQFTDPRARPVSVRPGIGHLLESMDRGWLAPLAIEYDFWTERTPEVLLHFGTPVDISALTGKSATFWTTRCNALLEDAQDELALAAQSRDSGRFTELLGGTAGVGGVYDQWRRMKARWSKEPFSASHGDVLR